MNLSTATPVEIDSALAKINSRAANLLDDLAVKSLPLRSKQIGHLSKSRIVDLRAEISALQSQLEGIRAEEKPSDGEYVKRGGWSRYFIVQHLHTSTRCPSFRPATRIGWLPDYSGANEQQMIEAAGDMVCTRCVPDAPTAQKRPTLPALAVEWDKAHAQEDECQGFGRYMNRDRPHRDGYAYGNNATCEECHERVGISSRGKIRKHKLKL